MRRLMIAAGAAMIVSLLAPSVATAQFGGFNRQQQSQLLLMQQYSRTRAQSQQQRQMQVIQRQFTNERRENSRMNREQLEMLLGVDPYDPSTRQEQIGRFRRGTADFGDMHYGSAYFNRLDPYFNYAFIARRNRSIAINLSGASSSPSGGYFGGIFFGNFGIAGPVY